MKRLSLLFFSIALSVNLSAQESLRAFKSGSLIEIDRVEQGKPYIVSFWSLDCPSCIKELNTLAKTLEAHPELKITLVSTDTLSDQDAATAMLEKQGLLHKAETWIFADADDQKLRYEVDPSWFGELPRSYLYDANHARTAQSGALTETQLEAWYSTQIKPQRGLSH